MDQTDGFSTREKPNARLKSKKSLLVPKLHSGFSTIHIKSRNGHRDSKHTPKVLQNSRDHAGPIREALSAQEHAQTAHFVKVQ